MRRRALLAAASTLLPPALAGCALTPDRPFGRSGAQAPTARFAVTAATPVGLVGEVLSGEYSDRRARLLGRAVDGGATATGTEPPLRAGHRLYRGTVYDLSRTVVERTPATRYSVKVDVLQTTPDPSAVVRFGDLPAVDRETFADEGLAEGEVVGIGTTLVYTDAERERSALVPESAYEAIAWPDGTRAEWVVDDAYDTTLETYRYTAEPVADREEYGRRLRDRFAFDLTGLSGAERGVVETAIARDRYVVAADATPDPGFRSLVDRFRGREELRALDDADRGGERASGTYVVRYGGSLYLATLVVYGDSLEAGASR